MCQFINCVVFIAVLGTAAVTGQQGNRATGQQDTLADVGLLCGKATMLTECCKMLHSNRKTASTQSLWHSH